MTLQELVHQAASVHMDRTAVCFDEGNSQPPVCYTYKALLSEASELSSFLLAHCDFGGIREIGLYCQPGINLPSWILGVLQVPAAYAPVDPDSPPSLSTHFMKKCGLKYVLVEKKQVNKFRSSHEAVLNCNTVSEEHKDLVLFRLHWENREVNSGLRDRKGKYKVDDRKHSRACESGAEEKERVDLRQECCLAYVLHTSGTTGTPKIVRVPHACILPNVQHFRVLFGITQEDVLFLASPLTFDPSVVEIFVSLSSGACLLIVPTSVKVLPSKLADVLFSRHRVTVLQATPTLLRRFGSELIKSTVLSAHTSLRVLALGGEAFPSLSILRSWRGKGNRTQIFNIYGITEVSSWATFYRIPEEILNSTVKHDCTVQLGSPLLGTVVEVRDADGSPVHEGTGQVFLGGENRVCFLDDDMTVPPGTMRATGDIVTVKDGEMFFLGRKDSQIKRHGKRLNIEFVQQVAEDLPQVETCAVTWYNQEKLVLFVVVSKAGSVKDCIFKELRKHLPTHALPDDVVLIDSLPFTCHGKIDVSELNKRYLDYINSQPRNKPHGKEELWEKLQYLWKSVLSLPEDPEGTLKVPDNSTFLDSGGDSLKSTWLLNEIEKLTGTPLPGLLEVILSSSLLDVYSLLIQTVFAQEDPKVSRSYATKRKLSDTDPEEAGGKPAHLPPALPSKRDSETNAVLALSRGSQALSLGTGRLLTKSGHCPSVCPLDLIPQMNTQILRSIRPPVPDERLEKPPVSQERSPGAGAERMVLRERWRSDTGKCVDASPLLVIAAVDKSSTTMYVGSHSHRVQAVDLYSGKMRWEQLLGDRIESSACVSKCGNFIVVGCYNGLVYVLKSNSGEKYWTFTTEDAVKSSPALDPTTGLIYVGSHDQHAYALDIYEKTCVWKLNCGGTLFSSPCLSLEPHHLYCATLGGLLLAINPATGSIVWKHSCGKPLFSSPRCCQRYICIGCVDGGLLCFTHSGEQVWCFSAGGPIFSSPCISASEQEVFFGSHDCFLYCCSAEGHLRWKFETTARVYATPFAFCHHGRSNETLLAAASTDGKLWVLECQSGELRSVCELPGEVFSSPVVWESMLVIGCRNNYIYCLDLLCADKNNHRP